MSALKDEILSAVDLRMAWQGTISSEPSDQDDTLYVVIPDFHPRHRWGPCYWQHRGGISLPQIGDICLVQFDNNRRPWVTAWWPF